MKNKLFIDIKDKKFYKKNADTASSKPRLDAQIIAEKMGFKSIVLYNFFLGIAASSLWIKILYNTKILKFVNNFLFFFQALRLYFIKNSILFLQYPFFNKKIVSILKTLKKNNKIILLVHDLESFRSYEQRSTEIGTFNLADVLIVHSTGMKEILQENGCTSPMVILEFFDFLSDFQACKPIESNYIKVLYAGNLTKSKFISGLNSFPTKDNHVSFYLYGRYDESLKTNDVIEYKGVFNNDHIDHVEGNWGLVWDGESVNTCSGTNGEYLKLNAPFKLSLYLALGIPVIVWSKSAMAEYVKNYNLGICVDKLKDIEEYILSLVPHQIDKLEKNIKEFSQKVKSGEMLTKAVRKSLSILEDGH